MRTRRMLFVDDEPSIRLTLPEILRMHGYDVEVASTVSQALSAIQNSKFDILISDLNIGNPGDGITVVSAMRRTQPQSITLNHTGYPGFETALQAIRSQVDDYLVKPTNIGRLVDTIESKLQSRSPHKPAPAKRAKTILRDWEDEIVALAVPALSAQQKIPEAEIRRGLPELLSSLITGLDAGSEPLSYAQGASHGKLRREQGGSIDDLFDEFRLLERIAYEVLQENLLAIDVSNLVPDLRLFNDHVQNVLRHAVNAHLAHSMAA